MHALVLLGICRMYLHAHAEYMHLGDDAQAEPAVAAKRGAPAHGKRAAPADTEVASQLACPLLRKPSFLQLLVTCYSHELGILSGSALR